MNTSNKIATIFGITIGILGMALGVYATINPMAVANIVESPGVNAWGPYIIGGIIVISVLLSMWPLFGMGIRGIKNIGLKKRLRESGVKTTATITDIQDTGVTVNLSPLVRVTVETKEHHKGTFNTYVSRVGFPSPGDEIEVVYNPENPEEMLPAYKVQLKTPSNNPMIP